MQDGDDQVIGLAQRSTPLRAYAAERWASAIKGLVNCNADPRTVTAWARGIGVSGGALRSWCRAAHVPAKSSLDFGRLLRAVVQSRDIGWDPQNLLDIVDDRTLRHLFARAGLSDALTSAEPPTVEAFLSRQCLARDPAALRALADLFGFRSVDWTRPVANRRQVPRPAD